MTDILVKAIMDHIPNSLVFNEKIRQGYSENCFVVQLISGKKQKHLKNTYITFFNYKVICYTTKQDIYEKICQALHSIDHIKIINISFENSQDKTEVFAQLLEFSFDYNQENYMKKLNFQ